MPAERADFLLIDNSNSFTKFAIANRKGILSTPRRLATSAVAPDSMTRVLHAWEFEAAIVCSVVPEKGEVIREFIAPRRVLAVTAKTKLGVGIDYPQPGTIGADRLANAAAAFEQYGGPCVVVDFG
ncbi:type III pantothenate kinase, partial [Arcanobacterium phocae]|uniref:type III pantothenate kinase n=1 Tax=Arcanobacterium phocae TaxID=131112 RepID=UPI001C0FFD1D